MDKYLVGILYGYFLYMNFLLFHMFSARKKAVAEKNIKLSHFRAYTSDSPERLVAIKNHFNNQFQMPMLFFAVCLISITLEKVSLVTIILALCFFASRLRHSYIFLSDNNVLKRAKAYAIGLTFLNFMWIELLVKLFS